MGGYRPEALKTGTPVDTKFGLRNAASNSPDGTIRSQLGMNTDLEACRRSSV